MPSIPLARSDYRRLVAQEAEVLLRNRFVEPNPVLSDNSPSFIQRPGLRFWQLVGAADVGQNRAVYSFPGTFDDDLFVVSGPNLYRVKRIDGTYTLLTSGLSGTATNDAVRMAATGDIGVITPYLWIADGAALFCYDGATVTTVTLPDSVGALDVAVINNFVIVVPTQGNGINGRFYWINPGETTIDPLDYATAERSPDPIYQVVVFSDQFWLPGQNTTEVYYMSGDPLAPVTRFQGVVFDRGVHPGCALQVFNSMVLIDSYGGVYQIRGGERKISTPEIEERLRRAIMAQNIANGG